MGLLSEEGFGFEQAIMSLKINGTVKSLDGAVVGKKTVSLASEAHHSYCTHH